jgi:hypothetical protein
VLVGAPSLADLEVGTGCHGRDFGRALTSEAFQFVARPDAGKVVVEQVSEGVIAVSTKQIAVGDIAVRINNEEVSEAIAGHFAALATVRKSLFDVSEFTDSDALVTVLEPPVVEVRQERPIVVGDV